MWFVLGTAAHATWLPVLCAPIMQFLTSLHYAIDLNPLCSWFSHYAQDSARINPLHSSYYPFILTLLSLMLKMSRLHTNLFQLLIISALTALIGVRTMHSCVWHAQTVTLLSYAYTS